MSIKLFFIFRDLNSGKKKENEENEGSFKRNAIIACQQGPISRVMQYVSNCLQTAQGHWARDSGFAWVGTTIQIMTCQKEDKNPEKKEVNTNLSYEAERK